MYCRRAPPGVRCRPRSPFLTAQSCPPSLFALDTHTCIRMPGRQDPPGNLTAVNTADQGGFTAVAPNVQGRQNHWGIRHFYQWHIGGGASTSCQCQECLAEVTPDFESCWAHYVEYHKDLSDMSETFSHDTTGADIQCLSRNRWVALELRAPPTETVNGQTYKLKAACLERHHSPLTTAWQGREAR